MATVEDLIRKYQTDEAFQKEVKEALKDGKISASELIAFGKRHGVKVSLTEVPKYLKQLKEIGLIR